MECRNIIWDTGTNGMLGILYRDTGTNGMLGILYRDTGTMEC